MVIAILIVVALLAVGFLGPIYRPRCPECRKPADRVIHFGIPMWLCFSSAHDHEGDPGCLGLGILSALIGTVLPFDGHFFVAEGPYLVGLWKWWRHQGCEHKP